MADFTTNYDLKKPLPNDFYDVADQNNNMDLIDAGMKANADAIQGLQEELTDHAESTSNPHSVTAAQVGAVPITRTINGKALSADIVLTASDVGVDESGAAEAVQDNLDTHTADKSNPHSVTAAQVGLGNVDNTADVNKPISAAAQAALDDKADLVGGKVPVEQLPSMDYDSIGTAASAVENHNEDETAHPILLDVLMDHFEEIGAKMQQVASNAVPVSRTVNGKALSSDITLSSADVGAIPTMRKVNNKELSSDITLSPVDIGAAPATHSHDNATAGASGLMSAADKEKLDGISIIASTVDLTHGVSELPEGTIYLVYE